MQFLNRFAHLLWLVDLMAVIVVSGEEATSQKTSAKITEDGFLVEPTRNLPVTHRADIVVVGASYGGLGGCMAAVAAAKHGANVILIEELGTVGLHIPISMGVVLGIDGWRPNVNHGLFRELCEHIVKMGQYFYSPQTLDQVLNERQQIIVRYHDIVSNAMLSLMKETGVRMLFHTKVVDVVVENGTVKGVIVESPSGRHAILGKAFVDSTGLADLATMAGAPMLREEPFMGVQVYIGGVDEPRYRRWIEEEKVTLDNSYQTWLESQVGPLEDWYYPWDQWWLEYLGDRMPGAVVKKVREATEKGELTLVRRCGNYGVMAIPEGIKTNTGVAMPRTYITGIDPLNVDDIAWAEYESRLALDEYYLFLKKYIPGFEECVLERIADTYGLRGGRYIQVDDPPTEEDRSAGKKNADCIFVIQRGKDRNPYEFPFSALVPKEIEGLLVVGKSTGGARHFRTAHDVLFMGQAAGTAAMLAAQAGVSPGKVDITKLQTILKEDGVEIPY